ALAWLVVGPRPYGWVRQSTTDGACSIEFSGPPRHKLDPDGEADGHEVVLTARNAHFSLVFSDLGPEAAALPTDEQFDLLRALFASKKTSAGAAPKLVKEEVLADGGWNGREFVFAVGDQFVTRIKVFVRGPRVYRAIAVVPPDPALEADAKRFIGSFRVEAPR
ncbi:MAG: hypothetical protein K2V38_10650, partial [Gemmataceae bacterium]|nr:hypothetical protein [Gemmataceae bacterium]